jgi:hypothetical protein
VVAAAAELDAVIAPGSLGVYVNYMGSGLEDPVAAFGANLPRVVELKRRYDPENVFRGNVSVL